MKGFIESEEAKKLNERFTLLERGNSHTSNILLYDKIKKEFIICSNFTQLGNEVSWDWGHYYTELKPAMLKLFENEIYFFEQGILGKISNTIEEEIDNLEDRKSQIKLYEAMEKLEDYIKEIFNKLYEE